ncbi:alpha/beta hydrolase-fold protein [Chitinophaga sp. XS-30]|uniref:alpha/beta hydrolase-fold protein n=1 Tax=Chitinophaga sp. XS-30 TaxID=2604421 RepID=UPI0011DCA20B|nr:alpha/beta hydrolase-fold protein [Chitinophaga sp. XS-30]QEH39390.1 hypothetical protein FW415_00290 [Chitinophaga sp. XS-30]
MVRQFIFITALFSVVSATAQVPITEKLYSAFLEDSINYQVTLPENWDADTHLPVLYALKYGMIDGPYIASQLRYFKTARYAIPNMIVVTIMADMDRIGFIYRTGQLTETGRRFLRCLKEEIITTVTRKYHTSGFNAYIGHSYAASYANYLVQHEPGIFNGYILLAPEMAGLDFTKSLEGQSPVPTFTLDEHSIRYYSRAHTFYYVAVGEQDMARRHLYARNILDQLKGLDSLHFFSKYDSIPRGNHTNMLTLAIQPGLEFISQFFNPGMDVDPERNAWEAFKGVASRVKDIYGMEVERNHSWYGKFAQLAVSRKDTASLLKILNYFDTGKLKGYDTRSFGTYCAQIGLVERAEQYYRSTIGNILSKTEMEGWEYFVLSECYWRIASEIAQDNHARAWENLQQAVQFAEVPNSQGGRNMDIYFLAGRYLIDKGYNVKEGIGYLIRYMEMRKYTIDEIHWSHEKIYACLGKGYYLLKDMANARLYLRKALALNETNTVANEYLKLVDGLD